MAEGKPPFLILSPALQTYAWGRKGQQGEACRLKSYAERDFEVDENQTYAEVRVLCVQRESEGPAAYVRATLLRAACRLQHFAL